MDPLPVSVSVCFGVRERDREIYGENRFATDWIFAQWIVGGLESVFRGIDSCLFTQ